MHEKSRTIVMTYMGRRDACAALENLAYRGLVFIPASFTPGKLRGGSASRGAGNRSSAQCLDETAGAYRNIERVIVGKRESIKFALVGLLARGHLLIEDVPGVGKTTLARALAKSIDCDFKRIQFTPDLLPSDVVGVSIYDQRENQFTFHPGPLFTSIVLADEINRTTPRTQSALLEAMNDFQVSVDGVTYPLPQPFIGARNAKPH